MYRLVISMVAFSLLVVQPVMAEEAADSQHADYAILGGASPFGGSLSFATHQSTKTSFLFTLGGLPGGLLSMDGTDIGGNEYDIEVSNSWVGAFVNHRPIDGADWFRLVAGIGIGNIENTLTAEDGTEYEANYTENPVGYLGFGFGADTSKGFQWGLDIGWLQTGGPNVSVSKPGTGPANPDAIADIKDNWMFGKALPNFQLSLGYGF